MRRVAGKVCTVQKEQQLLRQFVALLVPATLTLQFLLLGFHSIGKPCSFDGHLPVWGSDKGLAAALFVDHVYTRGHMRLYPNNAVKISFWRATRNPAASTSAVAVLLLLAIMGQGQGQPQPNAQG